MAEKIIDPLKFLAINWPDIRIYDKQAEIAYSVRDNTETYVPAGNGLGKDFISAFIALWFFCSRRPARVVTTSVKADQLNDVLWGEIRRFVQTSKYKLPIEMGQAMHIWQVRQDGSRVPLCELVGQSVAKGESLLGRHLPRDIPRTLVIFDEASGISTQVKESTDTWAHRKLVIGNPFPCENFFKEGVKAGDKKSKISSFYFRKVIQIKAEDSPNVQLARQEIAEGKKPSHRILIPGLVDFHTVQERREEWDAHMQSVGLDAEFYEGQEVKMYPHEWRVLSGKNYLTLRGTKRQAKTMGIDTAEGGDDTVWTIVDELGVIKIIGMKTPDTSIIVPRTISLIREFNLNPRDVYFDQGGGGKEHADILRRQGFNVRTIAFGESTTAPIVSAKTKFMQERIEDREIRYTYVNRRAEMYGKLRLRMNPQTSETVFAIPLAHKELQRQLAVMPLDYDNEGRLYLPPKSKKDKNSKVVTLMDMLGCSPDYADSLVLATYGLEDKSRRRKITIQAM